MADHPLKTAKKTEFWIVSNLPPPVHGVSAFNQALCLYLDRHSIPKRAFALGTRGSFAQVESGSLSKVFGDLFVLLKVAFAKLKMKLGPDQTEVVLYFTPSQFGMSIFRDFLLSCIGSLLFERRVAHIHGCRWLDEWKKGGWRARLMHSALHSCQAVILLGNTFTSRMTADTDLKCFSIDNGVTSAASDQPRLAPSEEQGVRLLFLSNLLKAKGLWLAALSARCLAKAGVKTQLTCAGEWHTEKEKEEFHREFKSELQSGLIRLIGFADDSKKPELFKNADFFLLPSLNLLEGQPLSIIEAMSYGLPPLTTDAGGIPDLLNFTEGKLLCSKKHFEPEQLAHTLLQLVREPDLYHKVSQACLRKYKTDLTFEECARKILSVALQKPQESFVPCVE